MLKTQPKIIVVGAGVAGIAAAMKLLENGFKNVTIIEAEDRIGGRLHSVRFGNTIIELGAQWVHGEQENIVYEMVNELNLTSHSTKSSDYKNLNFFSSNNAKLNKKFTDRLCEIANEVLDDQTNTTDRIASLGSHFKEKYSEKIEHEFGRTNQEVLNVAKMMQDWFSKFYLCLDAAESWDTIAPYNVNSYKTCDGDQLMHWKNHGYSCFLDVLMRQIPNDFKEIFVKDNILLNKEVSKIIWDQKIDKINKVTLQCTDGSTYVADHVILTVSVAVLKDIYKTAFQPEFPAYKVNCVENIPLGTSHKIFLKFPKQWWPNNMDFSFLWNEDDRKNLLKEFPEGPVNNGRSWLEDLFGFYTIDSDPNILLGWIVGPMTKEVECLPNETVQNGSMFLLRKFVGKKYKVIEPEGILRSKWGTNPHFLGTYSYHGTSMEESGATHEDLAKPLSVNEKEVVLFAGEATHSSFFSTVHGAVETGYREAERLTEIYKDKN